ncbi:MAG TPA: hypothetical protein VGB00_12510 [Pyrinomonadaceae bacterium]
MKREIIIEVERVRMIYNRRNKGLKWCALPLGNRDFDAGRSARNRRNQSGNDLRIYRAATARRI